MIQYSLKYLKQNNWVAIVWTIWMCVLFFMPSSDLPKDPGVPGLDKVVHFGLFSGLVFLWQFRFPERSLWVCLIAIAFGIAVEFVQEWIGNGRSFDVYDIVADSLGAVSGWVVVQWFIKRFY